METVSDAEFGGEIHFLFSLAEAHLTFHFNSS